MNETVHPTAVDRTFFRRWVLLSSVLIRAARPPARRFFPEHLQIQARLGAGHARDVSECGRVLPREPKMRPRFAT